MVRIDLRTVTLNVPPQEVITKDNVTVRVNAVAYFRVVDPNKAITEVENYLLATSQISQTTLRSVLGKAELDSLLAERERLNSDLQQIIDEQTEPWGVKVSTVEVKDVELPAEMQRAIARQAEAERERRAKIIAADGEFQASAKLSEAANIMSANPATLQLRYLQTLVEIGVNNSTTVVFPLPLDLLKPLLEAHAIVERPVARADRLRPSPTVDVERARGLRAAAGGPDAARRSDAPRALLTPEVRIDQLTGLRAILAPGRAERPDAFAPEPARGARRRRARPARSARAARTGRRPRSGPTGPGGGGADTPGWRVRSVPNLYPVLGGERGRRAGRRRRVRARELDRPAARASTRTIDSDLFRSQPAAGSHEVLVSGPEHVVSLSELPDEQIAVAVEGWRERMRAHGDASYVHLIVNEGPLAGASLEHSHAQLYALGFVPAEIARERERSVTYHERTMGGHLLEDVATEEIRRRERFVAVDDEAMLIAPWASRSPVPPPDPAAHAGAALRRGERRRGDARDRLPGARRSARRRAAAQPLGPHRAARHRRVLLAHRHRPAAHQPRRLRARHRRRDQHLPARARGRRPPRSAEVVRPRRGRRLGPS